MTLKKVVVDILLPLLFIVVIILVSLFLMYLGTLALGNSFAALDSGFTFINVVKTYVWLVAALVLFMVPLALATIGGAL